MPENAADRASEPPASIAQNKRIGACRPTRQVHALLGAVELGDSLTVKDLPANLLEFYP